MSPANRWISDARDIAAAADRYVSIGTAAMGQSEKDGHAATLPVNLQ